MIKFNNIMHGNDCIENYIEDKLNDIRNLLTFVIKKYSYTDKIEIGLISNSLGILEEERDFSIISNIDKFIDNDTKKFEIYTDKDIIKFDYEHINYFKYYLTTVSKYVEFRNMMKIYNKLDKDKT